MAELGLGQPEIAWHSERDRIAEVGCFLGLVTGTLAKLVTDVKLMMQDRGRRGVRAFDQPRVADRAARCRKRYPTSCAYIHACAAVVRQHAAALLDDDGRRPRAVHRPV